MATDYGDITTVAKKALQFQQVYYGHLDSPEKRPGMLGLYFAPAASQGGTLMQWNGHSLSTVEEITQYLTQLPKTKHDVRSVDAQPLPGNQSGDSFLMTVNGKCVYDDEHVRFFFQRFVVTQGNDGKFYIVNDYYRWTGEDMSSS